MNKTNYQRLWRSAKKREVLVFNFAGEVVRFAKYFIDKNVKDKKAIEVFEHDLEILQKRYNKMVE